MSSMMPKSLYNIAIQMASHNLSTTIQDNIDKTDIPQDTSRLSASPRRVSSRGTHHNRVYTVEALANELAGALSSIQSIKHEWPPLLTNRPFADINNSENTDLSAVSHNSKNIELPISTVALSSGRHLVQKNSMIENGDRDQKDHSAIDPQAAVTCPSPLPKRYGEGQFRGFRNDYSLGQVARSSAHMVIESSRQEAADRISEFKPYDFAFIKRTNDSWTYAILAYRSANDSQEECMVFVMSLGASTKTIKKGKWAELIRCVVAREDCLEDAMGKGGESHFSQVETEYHRQLREACIPKVIVVQKKCDFI